MRTHIRRTCTGMFGVFALVLLVSTLLPSRAAAYSYAGMKWSQGYANFNLDIAGWDPNQIITPSYAWTDAGARFYFKYRGNSIYHGGDGQNTVTRFKLGSSALAVTYIRWSGSSVVEVDTVINMDYSNWSSTGQAGYYDIQNVMTHEFGHWLVLKDLYNWITDGQKTMYGSAGTGETKKRSLESDDINGIRAIYP